jgi:hypothetical protein
MPEVPTTGGRSLALTQTGQGKRKKRRSTFQDPGTEDIRDGVRQPRSAALGSLGLGLQELVQARRKLRQCGPSPSSSTLPCRPCPLTFFPRGPLCPVDWAPLAWRVSLGAQNPVAPQSATIWSSFNFTIRDPVAHHPRTGLAYGKDKTSPLSSSTCTSNR